MSPSNRAAWHLGFATYALSIIAGIGWVINVVALILSAGGPIDGEFVLRIFGVFIAPLGAILGWVM